MSSVSGLTTTCMDSARKSPQQSSQLAIVPIGHQFEIKITPNSTTSRYYMSADVTFFEETIFFSKQDESNSIQQVLPIPCLSPVVSHTHTTSNQGEIHPSSPINYQVELSPSFVSTYQSETQRDGSTVHEDPLDSCPSPSVVPTTDPSSSSSSHETDSVGLLPLEKVFSLLENFPSSHLILQLS